MRGAGARRAVATLLEESVKAAGADALQHLPRLVGLSAQALGDGEPSIREAYAAALAAAARHAAGASTGKELFVLLVRPLLQVLDRPARPMQQGAAHAMREVVRGLQPAQLRVATCRARQP